MEEMWLARDRDGKVHLFIDKTAPEKTIDGTWAAAEEVFNTYQVQRDASDVTVIEYDDNMAQVFANLKIDMKENASGTELVSSGRQVTVWQMRM